MAITCPVCGEENREGARICELCRAIFPSGGAAIENCKRRHMIAENQAREAEKLQNRLERYASNDSVPPEGRHIVPRAVFIWPLTRPAEPGGLSPLPRDEAM